MQNTLFGSLVVLKGAYALSLQEALQVKAEQLEARVGTLERQRVSAASQHRHQLSESEERLAESKALAAELEREIQALMLKLSLKASIESGADASLGQCAFVVLNAILPLSGVSCPLFER